MQNMGPNEDYMFAVIPSEAWGNKTSWHIISSHSLWEEKEEY